MSLRGRWNRLASVIRSVGKCSTKRGRSSSPRLILGVESLEDRITPAYNVTIGAFTSNLSSVVSGSTILYRPLASGASLSVETIQQDLTDGFNVVISSSNTAGTSEAGNIIWEAGNDLDFAGIGDTLHTLTLETGADSTTGRNHATLGRIEIDSNIVDSEPSLEDHLAVVVNTSANGGTIVLGGNIVTNGNSVTLTGYVEISGSVTVNTDGDGDPKGAPVTINGSIEGLAAGAQLTINAGPTSAVSFGSVGVVSGNIQDFSVTSGTINVSQDICLAGGDPGTLTFNGNVNFTGVARTISDSSTLDTTFNGNVKSAGELTVIGAAGSHLHLTQGTTNLGANTLQLTNTELDIDLNGIFASSGTVMLSNADLDINNGGTLAPGGVGTAGVLTAQLATGSVNFNAGSIFNVDLGNTSDRLRVSRAIGSTTGGNVDINSEAVLTGQGVAPGSLPVTLISVMGGGVLTPGFENTQPSGTSFVLGGDAVASAYSSTSFQVSEVPAGSDKVTGTDGAGYKYVITLTGGGSTAQLVVVKDASTGNPSIAVRSATTAWTLSIAPTGTSTTVNVDSIGASGAGTGTISAPRVNVLGNIDLQGGLTSLTVQDVGQSTGAPVTISAGGTSAVLTSIVGRALTNVNITLGSILYKLTLNNYTATNSSTCPNTIRAVSIGTISTTTLASPAEAGNFDANLVLDAGSITAIVIDTVKVAGTLSGIWDVRGTIDTVTAVHTSDFYIGVEPDNGPGLQHFNQVGAITTLSLGDVDTMGIDSLAGITTLNAVSLNNVNLTIQYLEALNVTGSTSPAVSGDVTNSTIEITGYYSSVANFRSEVTTAYGIGQVKIAGDVTNSTFQVNEGDVGGVTVGRFIDSNFYVGYTPNLDGIFDDPGTFSGDYEIASFRTTAVSGAAAFANSQVVAANIGPLGLTTVGVDNGGTTFGFKVDGSIGTSFSGLTVSKTPLSFAPGQNYEPSASGELYPDAISQGDFRFFAQGETGSGVVVTFRSL